MSAALLLVTITTLISGEIHRRTQLGSARMAALLQLLKRNPEAIAFYRKAVDLLEGLHEQSADDPEGAAVRRFMPMLLVSTSAFLALAAYLTVQSAIVLAAGYDVPQHVDFVLGQSG